jgi:hypothetical protein
VLEAQLPLVDPPTNAFEPLPAALPASVPNGFGAVDDWLALGAANALDQPQAGNLDPRSQQMSQYRNGYPSAIWRRRSQLTFASGRASPPSEPQPSALTDARAKPWSGSTDFHTPRQLTTDSSIRVL